MAALDRRNWLKQSSLALAALGMGGRLMAHPQSQPADWLAPWDEDTVGKLIRIGQNENPYGVSPLARKAMAEAVAHSNRYPMEMATALREKIARLHGLSKDHVLLGAGSSELLGNTAAMCASKGANVVTADPTFKLWFTAAELYGLQIRKVPLNAGKVHQLDAMLAAMDAQTRLVYVVNPHNPTGTILPDADLLTFAERVSRSATLLIDEAYTEYADTKSLAPLVADNRQVVVAKTFSKIHGMAGARVGYVLAHPDTIKKLSPWQPWANAGPSAVSLAGAMAAMDDANFMRSTRQQNEEVRRYVMQQLNQLGLPVIPSYTSFVYYDASRFAGDLAATLQAANIQGVRTYEAGTGWRRTSIGTMDEMQAFVKVLKAALG
jgi:histidinol-phosphate aminotransferase